MPLLVQVRSFLRNLLSSRRVDADLEQEVHSHLEMLIDENTRAGMPPTEAQRAARIGAIRCSATGGPAWAWMPWEG
jgi:hypothetical protein